MQKRKNIRASAVTILQRKLSTNAAIKLKLHIFFLLSLKYYKIHIASVPQNGWLIVHQWHNNICMYVYMYKRNKLPSIINQFFPATPFVKIPLILPPYPIQFAWIKNYRKSFPLIKLFLYLPETLVCRKIIYCYPAESTQFYGIKLCYGLSKISNWFHEEITDQWRGLHRSRFPQACLN